MFGISRRPRVEAPPCRVAALVHGRNAIVVIFTIAIPIPAGEELSNVAPLLPRLGAILHVQIVVIFGLELSIDVGVAKEVFAEAVIVNVTVVWKGIGSAFPS